MGPFTRWPQLSDSVLAAVVLVASLIAAAVSRLDDGQDFSLVMIADLPPAAYVIVAGVVVSLGWRRSHAIGVAGIVLAGLWLWAILGYGEGPQLAMVVALYSVGRYLHHSRNTIAALAAAIITATITGAEDPGQQIELAGAALFAVVPWYVGRRVRNRRDYLTMLQDRAIQLEGERDTEARQAVADERSRIARELHDVVAHRVSMMTVQAGAAKTIARDDLPAALDLSAYRIVQESLTNVVKHAGPNPNVDARLTVRDDHLHIEITNTTTRQTSGLPSSGYGIAGMQERAQLLGGTLVAGPGPRSRFTVTARLPLEPEPT